MTKHLALLVHRIFPIFLFIGLAWGQNPCEDERYKELLYDIQVKDLSSWTDKERAEWKILIKKCIDYESMNQDSLEILKEKQNLISSEQKRGNPCYDAKFLELKEKEFEEMSEREFQYFMLKERQGASFSQIFDIY